MIEHKFTSLGLSVALPVPDSVEEFDTLAGKKGATLAEAIDNIIYRGPAADFRQLLLHGRQGAKDENGVALPDIDGVEQITGIARKVEKRDTKTKNPDGSFKQTEVYSESEARYFARVLAETGRSAASFQPTADEMAKLLVFDPKPSARGGGPKVPPKTYVEYAEKVIAAGKGASLASKLTESLGRTIAEDADATTLAWAIQEDLNNKRRAEEANLLAGLT